MVKMIMTSPYPQMTKSIQQVSAELGFHVTIVEDTMTMAANKVERLIQQGDYEVVISRAGTAQKVMQVIDMPLVHCDNSDFDIMQAFINAKNLGDRIGFLTYPEEAFPYKMKMVSDIIGFEVMQLPYNNWEDISDQIKEASESGIDVIVGGGRRAFQKIRQYGMKVMPIVTSERIIRRALIRAHELALYRIAEREKKEKMNAVIHSSEEGIIVVNNKGDIETFNKTAEKIFNLDADEIIGNPINYINEQRLRNLLKEEITNNESRTITANDIVINCEPISIDGGYEGMVFTCREVRKIQQLENKIRRELHAKGLVARSSFADLQFTSKKMKDLVKKAKIYAKTDSTILIAGESGTGKELFAQSIHQESNKNKGPFVAINCAALPESLLESELFGYADGAFTGARKGGRPGLFELAHDGTIFLDEIGEVSSSVQARLLRVLQEREVMRIGGDRVIPVNIRIITATNKNLWKLVREGKFREDLYFRINVLRLHVPSLRDRKEDIPVLVEHLLEQNNIPLTWNSLSEKIRSFFLRYDWKGNVRELENIMERYSLCVGYAEEEAAFIEDILIETESYERDIDNDENLIIKIDTMEEIEKQIYKEMLKKYNNNRTLVAESLGVSRTTLWKKLN